MKWKLGLLLSRPPSHQSATTVQELAQAALVHGYEVYLYLIDEGVKNIHEVRYHKLAEAGVKVFVCAYGCQQHHVVTDGLDQKFALCGLVVLSGIIDACDRFLCFT